MTQHTRGYENFLGDAQEFTSESTPWWPKPVTAPTGAPNVIVMLIDDLGFSDLGPFGSEIPTPNIDSLADRGWVFTNYRTAPLCSPARAALMTGLNPHRAGFGMVAHVDPCDSGFTCELPVDAPTLAESLRAGGYATFMVGKWHLTPEAKMNDGGDRSTWPLQRGFDRYFGSMDGFTTLFHPHRLVRDNSVVDMPEFPDDFFLTDQLTTEAVRMIDELRVNESEQPFFLYFAHTAVHGPVQAKAVDIAKQRGRYAAGWDVLREERLRRQRELGIIAEDTEANELRTVMGREIPAWDALSDDEQQLFARHMEVYAAAVTEIDESLAALRQKLAQLGELDNTIIVLASDNGGTAEGGLTGTRSYFSQFTMGTPLPSDWVRDVPRDLDLIGGPQAHGHYPSGWARVSNTPYREFKGSVYEGGVRAPLIVSWPGAPAELQNTGLRRQFMFVSDLAPTILELAGVERLAERAGRPAQEIDGVSMVGVLQSTEAPGRERQHFATGASRALIDGEWKALSVVPPTPAEGGAGGAWELYHLAGDPTERQNVAGEHPDRTRELAETWRDEAWNNAVFPLDNTGATFRDRPETEAHFSDPVEIAPFRPPLERFRAAKLTVLRSFDIDIAVDLGADSSGVLVAHGDQGGGYQLSVEGGEFVIAYNAYGAMSRVGTAASVGTHHLVLRFAETEGLRWSVSLTVDGVLAAELEPVPMLIGMSPFTGITAGYKYGGPVDWAQYEVHRSFRFSGGTIGHVRYVPGARSAVDPTTLRAVGVAAAKFAD